MASPRIDTSTDLVEPLSNQEREILKGLVEGLSNQEISARLHLALRTVKWYNTQIYSKLGVANRKAAIEFARTRGLLSTAPETPNFIPRNNLPLASTRFVGRQQELERIANHLGGANTRLMTILAPGGMGKTRLALAAAERQVRQYRDGVFFVPLAALSSPDDIITAIAESVGFSFYGSAPLRQQLLGLLRERQMLLVLDNFEHLLDGALLVADILQVAAEVRVLTTSREQLNLQGEYVYELRGLDSPDGKVLEHASDYDAVRLFILSARHVQSDFEPQADDLSHVLRICQLTAGMPLAIELAAGWLDTLSLEHIGDEIAKGIDILESDLRDVPERHRSVRATFERTWSQLSDQERLIFMRLSVFRGGFSLQAAQSVAGANAHHLRRSVQKALIQAEGDERFAIHELLRQFGALKLAESGELQIRQRMHAAYFADFMQEARSRIYSSKQLAALNEIRVDFENIRVAWNLLVADKAFEQLPKFMDSLHFFLDVGSRGKEGVEIFEGFANALQSLPSSNANDVEMARVWARLIRCYSTIGMWEKGIELSNRAIPLLIQSESLTDLLVAYLGLALLYMFRLEHENTRRMAEAANKLARELGDSYGEAESMVFYVAVARMADPRGEDVTRLSRQVMAMYENLENPWGLLLCYGSEALGAFDSDNIEVVEFWSLKCLSLAKSFRNHYFTGSSALYLGIVASVRGSNAQAWNWLRYSLHTFWESGYMQNVPVPLFVIATVLLDANNADLAVQIMAVTESCPVEPGFRAMFRFDPGRLEELRRELKLELGPTRFSAAWERGNKRGLSAVIAQLLSEGLTG